MGNTTKQEDIYLTYLLTYSLVNERGKKERERKIDR